MENNNKYPAYNVGQDNLAKSSPIKDQDLSPSFEAQESINKNINTTPQPQTPGESVQNIQTPTIGPVMGTVTNTDTPVSSINYASLSSRAMANFIDGIIVGLISLPFNLPALIEQFKSVSISTSSSYVVTGTASTMQPIANPTINPLFATLSAMGYLLAVIYPTYFIGKNGATPGKKALKIRVIDKETNKEPGYLKAFLREFVGKFISSIVFSLGYIWAVWDKEKQGWHDKIAGTIVVREGV